MLLPILTNAQEIRTTYTYPFKLANTANAVQLVVVYDNSPSFAPAGKPYQSILAAKETLNQQGRAVFVTLLSTDVKDPPLVDVQTGQSELVRVFDELEYTGSPNEQGLVALKKYLDSGAPRLSPLLPTVIVFVTDQDDSYSFPNDTENLNPLPVSDVVKSVGSFFKDSSLVNVVGFFGAPDFSCAPESGSAWQYTGSRYEAFFKSFAHQSALPVCKFGGEIQNELVRFVSETTNPQIKTLRVPYPKNSILPQEVSVRVRTSDGFVERRVGWDRENSELVLSLPEILEKFKGYDLPATAEVHVTLDGPHLMDVKK